ncbi:hypothetical protein [Sediminibacterium soli]|uniref:hypothetical protein n=1 Tax=Sediminibacterium soli TaxID=2698829 RepID=UPI00137A93FB|nr:hypothetical protein [Sediminibacterium soli]NCI45606.1 hypothetical protein [Sediminibacterium soli]
MKKICLIAACILSVQAMAQSVVSKTYPVKTGESVKLKFDYPKIVHVSTWDKNEVAVTAKVNINDGENDSAFVLEDSKENGVLFIKNKIRDMDKLPRRYTLYKDGKKTVFRSKDDFRSFTRQSGGGTMSSEGVDMEITVEVKVPANTRTDINSVYGIVEIINFNAPANIDATYGGIDATVNESATGKLKATTSYGQIYSNLDLKITDKTQKDFFTSITAEPGKGPEYIFKSTYGKIYLRKP